MTKRDEIVISEINKGCRRMCRRIKRKLWWEENELKLFQGLATVGEIVAIVGVVKVLICAFLGL